MPLHGNILVMVYLGLIDDQDEVFGRYGRALLL